MNIEQETQSPQQTAPNLEAGTILKNKRETLGLTQKQIADRLKLRITVIQKIEENQFESDLVATFTRGYLRSYAKCVNIDEKIVFDALDHAGDAQHEEQKMQSFSRKTNTERHNNRIMSLTWGIFVIIAGISSIWWWQNQQQDTLALVSNDPIVEDQASNDSIATDSLDENLTVINTKELTMTDSLDSNVSVTEQAVDEATDNDMNSTAITAEGADKVSETKSIQTLDNTAQVTDTPPLLNELIMQFQSDCWIQVKDATGAILSTGIKKAGQSIHLSGTTPYKVVLGAPEGVSMTFASEPVDLSGYTSGKVARITLP